MKIQPKSITKTIFIILVIISISYFLYFGYSYYFEHAFKPIPKGIGQIAYLLDIFMFAFLLGGTVYYIKLLQMLLSAVINQIRGKI